MSLDQGVKGHGSRRYVAPWWRLIAILVMAAFAGCASYPDPPEARDVVVAASPRQVLVEGLAVLIERGFVIRHADLDLGRLDAMLATWPGYRLRLDALANGEGATRLSVSGYRGRQPLAPESLDALLAELLAKLQARRPADIQFLLPLAMPLTSGLGPSGTDTRGVPLLDGPRPETASSFGG